MSVENLLQTQEALAELKAQIQGLKLLAADLKDRHERLKELLAPSEAALRERTGYLDGVIREQLMVAARRVNELAAHLREERERSSVTLREISARIAQTERRFLRLGVAWGVAGVIAMTFGGYLALRAATSKPPLSPVPVLPAAVTSPPPVKDALRPSPRVIWPQP